MGIVVTPARARRRDIRTTAADTSNAGGRASRRNGWKAAVGAVTAVGIAAAFRTAGGAVDAPGVTAALGLANATATLLLAWAALRLTRRRAGAWHSQDAAPSDTHLEALFRRSSEVVSLVDRHGTIRYQSPSVEVVLGRAPRHLLGTRFLRLAHPADRPAWRRALAGAGDVSQVLQWRAQHQDGGWRWLETSITDVTDEPESAEFVLSSRDISGRVAAEEQIRRSRCEDELTGLANRTAFRDATQAALAVSGHRGRAVAVLCLDLDDFRMVNEGQGHDEGDDVLRAVGAVLRRCVRQDDVVARLDGDQFAILIDHNDSEADAVATAARLLRVLDNPGPGEVGRGPVGASIGIATAFGGADAGAGADEVLRNAAVALHEAKRAGKRGYRVFRPEMHAAEVDRLGLECDLREALRHDELVVHYQPIVDLEGEEIIGVEALLRWQHPSRGLVPPGEFIGMAESNGLIVPIGRWLLRRALEDVATWTTPSGRPLLLSVNLSARQLEEDGLVDEVRAALHATGVDPARITLEVTESLVLAEAGPAVGTLYKLKDIGLRLSIDDFGTGYSALAYLKRLPFDELKLDRSFINRLGSEADGGLVQAIISLAAACDLETVAEGVERPDQLRMLRAMGCRRAQGFHFARPLPMAELRSTLSGRLRPTQERRSRHRVESAIGARG